MMPWRGDARWTPTPEQLAAYVDGELDACPDLAALKRRVQVWVADHPEAAAAVEAQRRLDRLWHATTPPEPTEAAWADVFARLEYLPLPPPERSPARRLRPFVWGAATLAASAAAVWFLTAYLDGPATPDAIVHKVSRERREAPPLPAPPIEPFPVAVGDEVEILSVKGADTGTLVVGSLPVPGPIELVRSGEIEITQAEPDVRMGGGGPPMIWVRLDSEAPAPDEP